jgi:hypothetical protein
MLSLILKLARPSRSHLYEALDEALDPGEGIMTASREQRSLRERRGSERYMMTFCRNSVNIHAFGWLVFLMRRAGATRSDSRGKNSDGRTNVEATSGTNGQTMWYPRRPII